jgi:hypothetical protein
LAVVGALVSTQVRDQVESGSRWPRRQAVVGLVFAAAITGCTAHASVDPPPPTPNPLDRQAPIYAAVLRQYLTSGGGHDGGDAGYGGRRFPCIFVLDHTVAGASTLGQGAAVGGPIPGAVRRAITRSLADVGPLSLVPAGDAALVPRSRAEVPTGAS